jgi:hypothetical protein
VLVNPPLQLANRDQYEPAAADRPQFGEYVALKVIDAHADRTRRLGLREREPRHVGTVRETFGPSAASASNGPSWTLIAGSRC